MATIRCILTLADATHKLVELVMDGRLYFISGEETELREALGGVSRLHESSLDLELVKGVGGVVKVSATHSPGHAWDVGRCSVLRTCSS